MTDRAREFFEDLRQNWDNTYWWADKQWLMYIILCSILMVYELATSYLKLRMRLAMTPTLEV